MGEPPVRPRRTGRPPVVTLESTTSFRDLGGYPTEDGGRTRHNLVYRSAALSDVTDGDRAALAGLSLALQVDLRAAFEVSAAGRTVYDEIDVPRVHVPVLDAPDPAAYMTLLHDRLGAHGGGYGELGDLYTTMLDVGGPAFARAFRAATSRLPSLHLCTAGKDRTGLLSALLLRVARVADEIITVDYACSVPGGSADAIERALGHLDHRWGGAVGYLLAHGVPCAAIEGFRATFVDGGAMARGDADAPVIVVPDEPAELAAG